MRLPVFMTALLTGTAAVAGPYGVLVDAEGADVTYASCVACHSERIVAQQGLSRDEWEELLEWMVEEQGMTPISEPDYSAVLDYLATNYGIDRPNFPTP